MRSLRAAASPRPAFQSSLAPCRFMMSEMTTRKIKNPTRLIPPNDVDSRSPMSPKSSELEPLERPLDPHDPDELEPEPKEPLRELPLLLDREPLDPPLKELPPPGLRAAWATRGKGATTAAVANERTEARQSARSFMRTARRAVRSRLRRAG